MADQPARSTTLQVRVTPKEVVILERIGRAKAPHYSDVTKPDGSLNLSAALRCLIHEEARRRGYTA